MSSTLTSFAHILSQVAPSFGARIGQKGALVAGLCAIAMAAPASAQVLKVSTGPGQPLVAVGEHSEGEPQVEQSAGANGMSEQASRNVGRALGGVLGYAVGRVAQGGATMKALLTVGGLVVGDKVAKEVHASSTQVVDKRPAEAVGKVDPVVMAAINLTELPAQAAWPKGSNRSSGKRIPPEIAQSMTSLVIDAAAHRLVAQSAWKEMAQAEINAALRPKDASALQVSSTMSSRFKDVMRRNNESFLWFRNAVGALQNNGYNVEQYLALNRLLSYNVDHRGQIDLDHPLIRARADEIQSKQPMSSTLADTQEPQESKRVAENAVQR